MPPRDHTRPTSPRRSRARTVLAAAALAMAALAMAVPPAALAAPPANDDFANATVIPSLGGSTQLDSSEATIEIGEPTHFTAFGARQSVWIRWTAPATGTALVMTTAASFDTVLSVYTGSVVGSLTRVASGDDSPDPDDPDYAMRTSRETLSVTAGVTYSIAVDGARPGSAGAATFAVRMYGPTIQDTAPYPDAVSLSSLEFAANLDHEFDPGAQLRAAIEVCSIPMSGDGCVASGGSLQASGTTVGWVAPGDDVAWTSPALPVGTWYWHAQAIDDSGVGSPWSESRRVDVTSDVPAAPAALAPADAAQVHARRPAFSVRVRHPRASATSVVEVELCTVAATPVQSCAAAGGTVASTATVAAQADGSEPVLRPSAAVPVGSYFWRARATDELAHVSVWSPPRAIDLLATPTNDDFVDATTLVGAPVSWSGTNVDASIEPQEPGMYGDTESVWLTWTAPVSGTADFAACGGDFDSVMAIYQGVSLGALTTIAARDEGCGTGNNGTRIQLPVTGGTSYVIRIGGFFGATGAIGLDVELSPPPTNDDLAAASTIAGSGGPIDVDLVGATREPGEMNSLSGYYLYEPGVTVWFEWTAPASMPMRIARNAVTRQLDIGVFTGTTHATLTRVAGARIAPTSSPLTWTATAGTTYRIGLQAEGGIAPQSLTLEPAPPPAPTLTTPSSWSTTGRRPSFSATVNHPNPAASSTLEFEVCSTTMSTTQTCADAGGTTLASGTSAAGLADGATGSWQPAAPLDPGYGSAYWHARTTDDLAATSPWSSSRGVSLSDTYASPQLPSSGATTSSRPTLWATHYQPQPGATSTIDFEICTANPATTQTCAGAGGTVVGAGSSAPGLLNWAAGSWQSATALAAGTAYWRARVNDDYGVISSWSSARAITITASSPPPNDDFAAAEVLVGMSATSSGTNIGASTEYGEPSGSYGVWYRWTAPAASTVTIDVCGATFDSVIEVYTGASVTSLVNLAYNDDGCGSASTVTLSATAGTTYRIRVRGYGGSTGTFPVQLVATAPTPTAPTLVSPSSGASVLDGSNLTARFNHPESGHTGTLEFQVCSDVACSSVLDSGNTGSGIPIGGNGSRAMTTGLPLDTTLYWRARGIDELMYVGPWSSSRTIIITADAPLTAGPGSPGGASTGDVTPTLHATYRHVNTSRPGHVEFQVCTDATCTATVDAGSSSGGLVDGDDATWTVTTALATGQTWHWRARVVDDLARPGPWAQTSTNVIEVPANDDFAGAIVLPAIRARVTGTTVNATAEGGEPNPTSYAPHQTVWYSWTAPIDMDAQLAVESSDDDLYVAVHTGSDLASLSKVTSLSQYYDTAYPKVFAVTAGTTYYLQVDRGNWGSAGDFTLVLNQTLFPGTPSPLDGPWVHNDIDSQIDTTQLRATWDPTTDANGTIAGYEVCVQEWTGSWNQTCVVDWTSVGNVTAATIPLAMSVGDRYRICVRTNSVDVTGFARCTTGVNIVAALPTDPPPPTMLTPGDGADVADPPTLEARANFNDPADSGTLEFESFEMQDAEGWFCDDGAPALEAGAWGPGLHQGDTGSFDTTTSPSHGHTCWRARTVDSDGDASTWTDTWSYTIQNAPGALAVSVEAPQIDAGQVTAGATALTQFNVSINTGGGGANLFVHDSSATAAATCACGDSLLDVPLGSDPDWWPAGDHPGHAGLTVLDTKGSDDGEGGFDDDWRDESRWGDAPASGADLHALGASKWAAVGDAADPLHLEYAWNQLDVRLGYRMSFGPSPEAGTYSTTLVFTAIPSFSL